MRAPRDGRELPVRVSTTTPRLHLFVCANRREGSPLGPGCGERGELVYEALKREVAGRGLVSSVWVTKTHCLGICPKSGATVARHTSPSSASPILSEVEASDAAELLRSGSLGCPQDELSSLSHE